jgi:hypothetical protein
MLSQWSYDVMKTILLLGICFLVLAGCMGNIPITHTPAAVEGEAQKIAMLLDGTADDEASHTNISKLHSLISLQPSPNIKIINVTSQLVFYSAGVAEAS